MTIALKADAGGTFGEVLIGGSPVARFDSGGLVTTTNQDYFNQGNILGTVSQSGGIPTGAIIEYGTNANGEFIRYADGTQIVWAFVGVNSGGDVTWTFPASFASGQVPRISGTCQGTVAQTLMHTAQPTDTSVTLSAYNTSNARVTTTARAIAIGRWF